MDSDIFLAEMLLIE